MRSLVAGIVIGKSSGRNGRARTDSGGRTEGAVVSQSVLYDGNDDVCVVEIAMQVGAGMQAGRRAGERQRVTARIIEWVEDQETSGK